MVTSYDFSDLCLLAFLSQSLKKVQNWCLWTMVLEKRLESPLDYRVIKPVNPKGNQSWIFIGRTDAEDEILILWPSDVKNRLIWKDPDAGKDWRWGEKGTTEHEMAGWHHLLHGHEFEWALGVGDGQGGLACCSPWGRRVGHNWATKLNWRVSLRISSISSLSLIDFSCFISEAPFSFSFHFHASLFHISSFAILGSFRQFEIIFFLHFLSLLDCIFLQNVSYFHYPFSSSIDSHHLIPGLIKYLLASVLSFSFCSLFLPD